MRALGKFMPKVGNSNRLPNESISERCEPRLSLCQTSISASQRASTRASSSWGVGVIRSRFDPRGIFRRRQSCVFDNTMSLDRTRIRLKTRSTRERGHFGVVVGQVVRLRTIASHKSGSTQSSRAWKRSSWVLSKHAKELSANEPRIRSISCVPRCQQPNRSLLGGSEDGGLANRQQRGRYLHDGSPRLSSARASALCCC